MKSFEQFLDEAIALERVHANPSIAQIKSLAQIAVRERKYDMYRNSSYRVLRFSVARGGLMIVGAAYNFDHADIENQYPGEDWLAGGYISETPEGLEYHAYSYRTRAPLSMPTFDKVGIRRADD